jgi:hypothetical protein
MKATTIVIRWTLAKATPLELKIDEALNFAKNNSSRTIVEGNSEQLSSQLEISRNSCKQGNEIKIQEKGDSFSRRSSSKSNE